MIIKCRGIRHKSKYDKRFLDLFMKVQNHEKNLDLYRYLIVHIKEILYTVYCDQYKHTDITPNIELPSTSALELVVNSQIDTDTNADTNTNIASIMDIHDDDLIEYITYNEEELHKYKICLACLAAMSFNSIFENKRNCNGIIRYMIDYYKSTRANETIMVSHIEDMFCKTGFTETEIAEVIDVIMLKEISQSYRIRTR